jgi:Ser/Thr protein kinase RdoA (MazF antagonist)
MCDTELFAPLVSRALAAHGLPLSPIEAGFPGTHAVFRAGGYVVKLYAPLDIPDEYAERRCYRAANGMPLIPRLYGEGILRAGTYDWPYIVTEFMPGKAVRELWPEMGARERADAMRALGAWAKAYHALPDPFEPSSPLSIEGFERARRETAERTKAKLGDFGKRAILNLDSLCARERPTLIHMDLTEDHLLIAEGGYAVIDLADSRMNFEQAEWICVWFELTRRDPDAFFAFLNASGRNWDAGARMDMMTAALLHGFGANILNSWSEKTGLSFDELFPEV